MLRMRRLFEARRACARRDVGDGTTGLRTVIAYLLSASVGSDLPSRARAGAKANRTERNLRATSVACDSLFEGSAETQMAQKGGQK